MEKEWSLLLRLCIPPEELEEEDDEQQPAADSAAVEEEVATTEAEGANDPAAAEEEEDTAADPSAVEEEVANAKAEGTNDLAAPEALAAAPTAAVMAPSSVVPRVIPPPQQTARLAPLGKAAMAVLRCLHLRSPDSPTVLCCSYNRIIEEVQPIVLDASSWHLRLGHRWGRGGPPQQDGNLGTT